MGRYPLSVKHCTRCDAEHSVFAFSPNRANRSGLQSACRDSSNRADKARYHGSEETRARSIAFATEYLRRVRDEALDLLGGRCVRCGEADRVVLDIDHIDGSGHVDGRNRGGLKLVRKVRANPGQFQLLCCNCHRRKTAAQRNWSK